MADRMAGVLTSATSVLKRAVELDTKGRYGEAVICYQEGLQLLMDVLKGSSADKKEGLRNKIKEYMNRAEELQKKIEEQKEGHHGTSSAMNVMNRFLKHIYDLLFKAGKYHEQIRIENNSTGHSYEKLFGRFLDESLTGVVVEDPYIRSAHQMYNFLRFCELLIKSKSPVKSLKLVTGQDDHPDQQKHQQTKLEELRSSLLSYNVTLDIEFSQTLHDREIRLNNGWIIKIGRGLDIYKATEGKFVIGFCDYDLRKCHETTVDIFHRKHVNSSFGATVS